MGFLVGYFATVIVGLIPVNNDFVPANEGITIYVASNDVHADIIVPVETSIIDWRRHFPNSQFQADIRHMSHLAVGWGDRGFYLDTPRWKDLKVRTAVNAMLLPSQTVMHVQYFGRPKTNSSCKSIKISTAAYAKLVDFIQQSFAEPTESRRRIDFSYTAWDAFYAARGRYHLFNTCNCWVGRALKRIGVTTPWFAPLPNTVLWYLPQGDAEQQNDTIQP